jgi:hypothetical protein
MADFVVGVVGDVLRHVGVEILECRDAGRVSGVRIIVVIYGSPKLVVLLPQVSFYELGSRSKSQEGRIAFGQFLVAVANNLPACSAAAPATPTPCRNERRWMTRRHFVVTSSDSG